jgi:hypothetical protein
VYKAWQKTGRQIKSRLSSKYSSVQPRRWKGDPSHFMLSSVYLTPAPDSVHHRFRPNIVLQGAGAFAEDNWGEVTIGSEFGPTMTFVAKCGRCLVREYFAKQCPHGLIRKVAPQRQHPNRNKR